jgi:DNA repair protein RecO (recombination protein O)
LNQNLFSDIRKNAVAVFMIELLSKCLKQPEANNELFYFTEDALYHLNKASETVTANFPLFFALHLAVFFGFRVSDEFSDIKNYLDLVEGTFVEQQPGHTHYLQDKEAAAVSHILKIMHPDELQDVVLNQEMRRRITHAIEEYYALHVPDFGTMRTLPVLREIMNG